jgi:hypothetical protein
MNIFCVALNQFAKTYIEGQIMDWNSDFTFITSFWKAMYIWWLVWWFFSMKTANILAIFVTTWILCWPKQLQRGVPTIIKNPTTMELRDLGKQINHEWSTSPDARGTTTPAVQGLLVLHGRGQKVRYRSKQTRCDCKLSVLRIVSSCSFNYIEKIRFGLDPKIQRLRFKIQQMSWTTGPFFRNLFLVYYRTTVVDFFRTGEFAYC